MIHLFLFLLMNLLSNEVVTLSTDRSLYAAGETVWIRGDVTDPGGVPASRFLYVELLKDGRDSVSARVKLKERSGMFFGQMDLPADLAGGLYTLRAYTLAQREWPAERMFHTRMIVRGSSGIPAVFADPPRESGAGKRSVEVSLSEMEDGNLAVTLTGSDGEPVAGSFSVSVTNRKYADFDCQAKSGGEPSSEILPEGGREYAQNLDFRVKSVRSHLPDKYEVSVMSEEIDYYYSEQAEGGRKLKGRRDQSFRIPDVDFPEGTMFVVNVTGSRFIYPQEEEEPFAGPYDYGPTYPARRMVSDTAMMRRMLEGTVAPLPSDDTLAASVVAAERKPAFYRPDRNVGPYSNVFEWRQVKLREELVKYDYMDLMTYITANFPGLYQTYSDSGLSVGRKMYTTRGGTFSHKSNGTSISHHEVALYIDGNREPDWDNAAVMDVSDVQNLYVLRGNEAFLYRASAVVLVERRSAADLMKRDMDRGLKATIGIKPLGWQKPRLFSPSSKSFSGQGTYYWNPCVRTDASGRGLVRLPELPDSYYLRIDGRTADGKRFVYCRSCSKSE